MTEKEKNLLIKDLCARLPYKTEIQVNEWAILTTTLKVGHISRLLNEDLKIKPYLFPMSSMTEEATREFNATLKWITTTDGYSESVMTYDSFDCLNKHHIDYRDLIPMGLAINATGLNIY